MAEDKKPGKLKFNPMMINIAAMRPGAKNKKLEELKKVEMLFTQCMCFGIKIRHILYDIK